MIYFMCYPKGDESRVTVIDLDYAYEIDDWVRPDRETFASRNDAIMHARNFAFVYGKTYELFESRYDSELNEMLGEFEGDDYNEAYEKVSLPPSRDLETLLMKPSEAQYQELIEDIKSGHLDSTDAVRLRLYRILNGD